MIPNFILFLPLGLGLIVCDVDLGRGGKKKRQGNGVWFPTQSSFGTFITYHDDLRSSLHLGPIFILVYLFITLKFTYLRNMVV